MILSTWLFLLSITVIRCNLINRCKYKKILLLLCHNRLTQIDQSNHFCNFRHFSLCNAARNVISKIGPLIWHRPLNNCLHSYQADGVTVYRENLFPFIISFAIRLHLHSMIVSHGPVSF